MKIMEIEDARDEELAAVAKLIHDTHLLYAGQEIAIGINAAANVLSYLIAISEDTQADAIKSVDLVAIALKKAIEVNWERSRGDAKRMKSDPVYTNTKPV